MSTAFMQRVVPNHVPTNFYSLSPTSIYFHLLQPTLTDSHRLLLNPVYIYIYIYIYIFIYIYIVTIACVSVTLHSIQCNNNDNNNNNVSM